MKRGAMKIKLPEPKFFSTADLAERWGKDERYVLSLLETGELPAADKYAALRGKRRTFFYANDFEPNELSIPFTLPSKVAEHYSVEYPIPTSDDLIIDLTMAGGLPELAVNNARANVSDSSITVVLHCDVKEFEEKHQTGDECDGQTDETKTASTFGLNQPSKLPGKTPGTWVGEVAVKIALDFEEKAGVKATSRQVMKKLRELAKSGDGEGKLSLKDGFPGVVWITSKSGSKEWGEEACKAALKRWNDSRQQ